MEVKGKDSIDLKIFWEGYKEPTWEGFCGFAKDTAVKCERYLIKSVINPHL